MSVTSVSERFTGPDMGQESPDAKNYTSTATRVFDVLVSDPVGDDESTVLLSGFVPFIRDSHPDFIGLRCSNISAKRMSPFRYEVRAQYTGNMQLGMSPLDMPPDISWSFAVTEEEIDQDANGDAILTAAGESFDPPIRAPRWDRVLRVVRNMQDYDDDLADELIWTTNEDTVMNRPPGAGLLTVFDGVSVADEDEPYWKVTCEWHFRAAPPGKDASFAWFRRVLAQGFFIIDINGKQWHPTIRGVPIAKPCLHHVADGTFISGQKPSDAEWYYFQIFGSGDHDAIGILDGYE